MEKLKELAKEFFDLTEELRLSQPMIRLDKEDEAIAYWENKIIEVSKKITLDKLTDDELRDECERRGFVMNRDTDGRDD